jgi:hypothetical protein
MTSLFRKQQQGTHTARFFGPLHVFSLRSRSQAKLDGAGKFAGFPLPLYIKEAQKHKNNPILVPYLVKNVFATFWLL